MSVPATAPRLRPEGVGAPREELTRVATERVVLAIALGVFALAVPRTAWICDDAYITFRTIDNFLHGYGLRWNAAERVQTFTDPLWLFLVAAVLEPPACAAGVDRIAIHPRHGFGPAFLGHVRLLP